MSEAVRRVETFGAKHALRRAGNAMLRITVHVDGDRCRLQLSGRLCGPWVGETAKVWHPALCSGKEIEVDMREVTGIDAAGRELLVAMHVAGARLVAKGVAMTALLEEITREQASDTDGHRRKKNLFGNEDPRTRRHTK
jgi:hypothetical protein